MRKAFFIPILLTAYFNSIAQQNIAHFSYWKAKPGQGRNFENAYKLHLKWHNDHADPWNWYGWYISSGERDDLFVDATFNHSWSDFDQGILPAEDAADNELHTYPFADFQGSCKMAMLGEYSIGDSSSLRSRRLRMITMQVENIVQARLLLAKLKEVYIKKSIRAFLPFKMVDGGNLNQLVIFIGINKMEDFSATENFQEEVALVEAALKIKTVTSLVSETLSFRADMSLIH
jgi:hypothetical protein